MAAQNRTRMEYSALRRNAGGNARRLHFFRVQVFPGNLPAQDLKVELYANPLGKDAAVFETMTPCDKGTDATVSYLIQVSATRPASDYTPRIVPRHPSASVPLEAAEILWQR